MSAPVGFLLVVYFLFLPAWVACSAFGMIPRRHRRFFARMFLLTPVWPWVACMVLGPLLVRGGLWVATEARRESHRLS
jgi:hypothetical protein